MKDIPMFTGTHGMASLVLKEIAVSGRAYVVIRAIWNGQTEAFLQECLGFCRAVGAEEVYASYDLEELPASHAYDMIAMEVEKAALPTGSPVEPIPLTEENGQAFLDIYNACFRDFPGASTYGRADLLRILEKDCGFLAKKGEKFAAIAEISENGLESIAVLPEFRGLGYDFALSVLAMVPRKTVRLKVASTNEKALALYTRLGFVQTGILSRWYCLTMR